jgi:pyruvate dehydrogenase E2 component (dihydrolipoamide acetyltransferase)
MARLIDVRVPDMGNFSDVAIIDVLVKPGDAIEKDASLITLETEKATMDVPSDVSGVIEKLHVAKGGTVSPGDVVATVRVEGDAAAAGSAPAGASAGSDGGPAASTAGTAAGSAGAGSAGSSGAGASGASAGAGSAGSSGAGASGGSAGAGSAGSSGAGASGGSAGAGSAGSSGAGASGGSAGAGSAPSAAATASSSAPIATPAAKTAAPSGANGAGNGASAPAATPIPGARTDLAPINEAGFSKAHAGPSVRRFARELGVDLSLVTGTGFKSRITHDDVKAYV